MSCFISPPTCTPVNIVSRCIYQEFVFDMEHMHGLGMGGTYSVFVITIGVSLATGTDYCTTLPASARRKHQVDAGEWECICSSLKRSQLISSHSGGERDNSDLNVG